MSALRLHVHPSEMLEMVWVSQDAFVEKAPIYMSS